MDVSLGVVVDSNLMISMQNIPVFITIDGAKTQVGTAYVDPETMVVTTKLDGSPNADLALAYLREKGTGAGMVYVSELNFQHEINTRPPAVAEEENFFFDDKNKQHQSPG